jgi:hypothetical protein
MVWLRVTSYLAEKLQLDYGKECFVPGNIDCLCCTCNICKQEAATNSDESAKEDSDTSACPESSASFRLSIYSVAICRQSKWAE